MANVQIPDVIVHIEEAIQKGFYYETKIRVERRGKAAIRVFTIPRASLEL